MGYASSFISMIYLQSRREFTQLPYTGDAVGSLRVGCAQTEYLERPLFVLAQNRWLRGRRVSLGSESATGFICTRLSTPIIYYAPENTVKSLDLDRACFPSGPATRTRERPGSFGTNPSSPLTPLVRGAAAVLPASVS